MNFYKLIVDTMKEATRNDFTMGFVNGETSFEYNLHTEKLLVGVGFMVYDNSVEVTYSEFDCVKQMHQYRESYGFSLQDDYLEVKIVDTIKDLLNKF